MKIIDGFTFNDYIVGRQYKIEKDENTGLVLGSSDSNCLMKVIAVDKKSPIQIGDVVWYDHSRSNTYRIDGEDYIVITVDDTIAAIEV
jgi:co-chaperonin GroES (HSP10)